MPSSSEECFPLVKRKRRTRRCNSAVADYRLGSRQKIVVNYEEAPSFLQHNQHIYRGYRTNLCTTSCLKSIFWWTNETMNTWTHLLGWIYFAYFTVQEILWLGHGSTWQDSVMMIIILSCFQICMAMSTGYHTFCCTSKDSYHCWLSYDLCGISFSLLAIYITGIYYAFWCHDTTRTFYIGLSCALFFLSLIMQTTPKYMGNEYSKIRLVFFMSWSIFGVLPCIHWIVLNGGFATPYVLAMVGRIGIMYAICALALFFYVSRIPEVWFPGCVDYIGSSHQWWHVIIFIAFCHWQRTGHYYAQFRARKGCVEEALYFTRSNQTYK